MRETDREIWVQLLNETCDAWAWDDGASPVEQSQLDDFGEVLCRVMRKKRSNGPVAQKVRADLLEPRRLPVACSHGTFSTVFDDNRTGQHKIKKRFHGKV